MQVSRGESTQRERNFSAKVSLLCRKEKKKEKKEYRGRKMKVKLNSRSVLTTLVLSPLSGRMKCEKTPWRIAKERACAPALPAR